MSEDIIILLKSINSKLERIVGYFESLQPDLEYGGKEERSLVDTHPKDEHDLSPNSKPQTEVKEEASMIWEMEYEGKEYKKFTPCKYKCGFWTGWGKPYKKGDKILHINPASKEIIGFQCPKFKEE